MTRRLLLLLALLFSFVAKADLLPHEQLIERIRNLGVAPSSLFYEPKTAEEQSFYQAGLYEHWQRYQTTAQPDPSQYNGYILMHDPFHRGLGRISFLLGTDCSNFVHRVLQLLGFEYAFMKTKQFMDLHKALSVGAPSSPNTINETDWNVNKSRWSAISRQDVQPGDIFVVDKDPTAEGRRGHMGIVTSVEPLRVLHASNSARGIQEENYNFDRADREYYFLRYVGPVQALKANTLGELLRSQYDYIPKFCSSVFR